MIISSHPKFAYTGRLRMVCPRQGTFLFSHLKAPFSFVWPLFSLQAMLIWLFTLFKCILTESRHIHNHGTLC